MDVIPSTNDGEKPTVRPNSYASKKAVAQRMADLALLTSNASQLRYILKYAQDSPTFGVAVSLIALSLILQVAVGIFLIFKMKKNGTPEEKERANNYVVAGVFLITIVNVLVSAFSFEEETKPQDATDATSLSNRFGNISDSGF